MSIRLTDDEAWAAIEAAHTGILTTLRADGRPITLPTWFVVVDRTVCLRTPVGSKKVARVRRDPRASFLVEHGEQWQALFGVHLSGQLRTVTDDTEQAHVHGALDEKYRDYRLAPDAMPETARQAYATFAVLRLAPEGRLLTWDNSRMRPPS
ncbi:pyridoxamine 5'-phosphate oxidase family protein [Pseudofrankia inefficax]|uniref:Pyridoxamine 5'-phosphate oxidase-related FMN-binding protein n=1 Tax=Pseudofrankia inefficax (strain DSM 45817 / CECT 9037 / DDB 130130 / EuI1c) TaxID=298654 RepID=E3IVA5_PSEI1|nr:pyridoxamine 5'-phosphate oxidase family protein [Pseudofrankia inefficax]ADP81269.1 pyridoxamine 5'-phosphate oxidase-related FMN-binding protein [Pseudofrankia inefficax]